MPGPPKAATSPDLSVVHARTRGGPSSTARSRNQPRRGIHHGEAGDGFSTNHTATENTEKRQRDEKKRLQNQQRALVTCMHLGIRRLPMDRNNTEKPLGLADLPIVETRDYAQ